MTEYNTAFNEWISWVLRRWRAQQSAIRDANCRNSWVIIFLNAIGTRMMSPGMNEGGRVFYITSLLRWIMKVFWFRSILLLNWWMFGTWRVYPWSCLTDKSLLCKIEISYLIIPPPFIQDYPPNLSISISGGKETNWDSLSNGEWRGSSPTSKGKPVVGYESVYGKDFLSGISWKTVPLRVIAP